MHTHSKQTQIRLWYWDSKRLEKSSNIGIEEECNNICVWCQFTFTALCRECGTVGKRAGTPSQWLLCERLFKLNWYFCNTALSERSGRRMAEALRQREAHCGQTASKVRCHCGRPLAVVKGHCGSWNATLEIQSCWVKSIRAGQRSPISLCARWVVCIVCLHMCVCANVYLSVCLCSGWHAQANCVCLWKCSWRRPFTPLGSAVCPLKRKTDRESEGQTMWTPPLCPPLCPYGRISGAIAEAAGNRKVLHETLWYKGSARLCMSSWRRDGTTRATKADRWTCKAHTGSHVTSTVPLSRSQEMLQAYVE